MTQPEPVRRLPEPNRRRERRAARDRLTDSYPVELEWPERSGE